MAIPEVLVYELAASDELDGREGVLQAALASQTDPTDSPWFESMPAGCFRWERGAPAREMPPLGVIRSPDTARAAAGDFMRRVNAAAVERAGGSPASRRLVPFPIDSLRPSVTRPVHGPLDEGQVPQRDDPVAEWLSTWTVWLPTNPRNVSHRAPVVGANVELRVGADGIVFSLSSRVRPWRAFRSVAAYDWRTADDGHGGHQHGPDSAPGADEPSLVYVSDPPTEALRFWSPYWAIEVDEGDGGQDTHHARRLWPACEYTVMPEIVVADERGEATLRAQVLRARQTTEVVQHGKGWTLRWAVASMAAVLAGERSVSESSSVSLGAGLYLVGLEVVHNATGARRSTMTQLVVPSAEAYDLPIDDDPRVS